MLYRGKLVEWRDDRGFGFIQPESGGKQVFLHISAISASRRPKQGDIILYQKFTQTDGKVRAANASIKGVKTDRKGRGANASIKGVTRRKGSRRASSSTYKKTKFVGLLNKLVKTGFFPILGLVALVLGLRPGFGAFFLPTLTPSLSSATPTSSECSIKGNISHNSGRKLYHLPGMEDYASTRIDPNRGERWFCTESEAIDSGWQKAPK